MEFLERLKQTATASAEANRGWSWRNTIVPRMKAAGFDERFCRELEAWPEKDQRKVFDYLKATMRGVGAIVALVGDRGTGKTTVCAQLAIFLEWEWLAYYSAPPQDRPESRPVGLVRYEKLTSMIEDLKPLYSDYGTVATDALKARRETLCNCGVLVIDEKHDCDDLKVSTRILTDVLDRRYSKLKDSIIISNETPEEFKRTTSDSIRSRISEHGRIVPCIWPSFRSGRKP